MTQPTMTDERAAARLDALRETVNRHSALGVLFYTDALLVADLRALLDARDRLKALESALNAWEPGCDWSALLEYHERFVERNIPDDHR